ncbi:DUF4291 family protein [Kitasatospora sp. NPDC001574]
MAEPPYRIRAAHTASTVTVYQAYPPEIGLPAARDGRFPAQWKRDRMNPGNREGRARPAVMTAGGTAAYDRRMSQRNASSPPATAPVTAPAARSARRPRGSVLSVGSVDSVLSIGSVGSVLSIGSVGSVLSVGSAGSALSALSAGSWLSLGSLLSAGSRWSVLSWRSRRGLMASGALAVCAVTAGATVAVGGRPRRRAR